MRDTGIDALDKLAASLPRGNKLKKARLEFEVLPDGRRLDDLSGPELASALKKLKIPGASPSNTVQANKAAYENFLQGEYDGAGELAVLLWHLEHEQHDGADKPDDEKDED